MINGIYERPDGLDAECVKLVDFLNNIDHIQTYESCCGHLKNKYMIFLFCNDFATLAKLSRAVNFNYSDGKWILEVDGTDTHPTYCFFLHSREPFKNADEMNESVNALIDNIKYWLNPKFDEYFNIDQIKKSMRLKTQVNITSFGTIFLHKAATVAIEKALELI